MTSRLSVPISKPNRQRLERQAHRLRTTLPLLVADLIRLIAKEDLASAILDKVDTQQDRDMIADLARRYAYNEGRRDEA